MDNRTVFFLSLAKCQKQKWTRISFCIRIWCVCARTLLEIKPFYLFVYSIHLFIFIGVVHVFRIQVDAVPTDMSPLSGTTEHVHAQFQFNLSHLLVFAASVTFSEVIWMNGPNEHSRKQKEIFVAKWKDHNDCVSKEIFWFRLGLFIRLLIASLRMICRQQRPLYWIQYIPLN